MILHVKLRRGGRRINLITVKYKYKILRVKLNFIRIQFDNPLKLLILQENGKYQINISIQYYKGISYFTSFNRICLSINVPLMVWDQSSTNQRKGKKGFVLRCLN